MTRHIAVLAGILTLAGCASRTCCPPERPVPSLEEWVAIDPYIGGPFVEVDVSDAVRVLTSAEKEEASRLQRERVKRVEQEQGGARKIGEVIDPPPQGLDGLRGVLRQFGVTHWSAHVFEPDVTLRAPSASEVSVNNALKAVLNHRAFYFAGVPPTSAPQTTTWAEQADKMLESFVQNANAQLMTDLLDAHAATDEESSNLYRERAIRTFKARLAAAKEAHDIIMKTERR